ncbi:MAG: FAD-binding protein [Candidatus Sumerlaeia bacterium]|nr:FAD-binding protein [Candidatus Sumerlaeia bacterium]
MRPAPAPSHVPRDSDDLIRELASVQSGVVRGDMLGRGLYATDASIYQQMPVAVVVPRTRDDVRATLRIARERAVPILSRGGGTSLAGQTTTGGIVLDLSKHLNRLLEVNREERWVRCEPGLVRDHLNAQLRPLGLMFAPETSTSNRATVGGMIGNNSSGMMSIRYGRTSEHVRSLDVLLADGSEAHFGPIAGPSRGAREAAIRARLMSLGAEHRERIEARWPRVLRRVGGYALDELLAAEPNLGRFLCGSEGTLAVTLEATLELVPPPGAVATMAVHFRDFPESLRLVPLIVAHRPLSVELLDQRLLRLSRENPATAPLCGFIEGDPAAILLVECDAGTVDEARARLRVVEAALRSTGAVTAFHWAKDDVARQAMHDVRRLGLGVMTRMTGDAKPVSFIEDAAVPVERLAEYIEALQRLCAEEGVESIVYGHASVGVLHFKPILNIKDPRGLETMDRLASRTVALVREFGGSWSGEHGDGIVRGSKNPEFWGPEFIELFREVKRLFDPTGLLNPGQIFDTPAITEAQRYGPGYRAEWEQARFHFRAEGGFAGAVEMCNGVGACRKVGQGTMCPSFMATRDEEHSTRGRANALRLAMTGQLGSGAMTGDALFKALDLCLECKACKTECPNNVDMAKMKAEVLAARHRVRGASARDRAFASLPRLARLCSGPMARIANPLQRLTAPLVKRALGIAAQRSLPPFATEKFSAWFARHVALLSETLPADAPAVAIFADTYTECYEPSIGIWMTRALSALGCRVELARAGCCCRPLISKGFLDLAKRRGLRTLQALDAWARRGIPVLVLEPSCLSALRDDLPDLIDDEDLGRRMAKAVIAPDKAIASLLRAQGRPLEFPVALPPLLLHGHCHQKAYDGTRATIDLLTRGGAAVQEVPSGCCGMAGSFGYEREHFDLSQRIGEDRLFPAVRAASPETRIVASGFSCRHQIAEATGRRPMHFAEAFSRALLGEFGDDAAG